MPTHREALVVAGLSSFLLTAASAGAQTITATVRGTVADQHGGVLPGVSITVRNLDTNTVRTAVTTDLGQYYLPSLPAGPYEIRTALEGLAPGQRQVELTVGADITVDFALAMSSLAEAITVEGRTSDVDLARATVGRTINKALVDTLPTANRDFVSLAQLAPGVSTGIGGNGSSLAINAQRGYQNNVFVDGASNQWQYYGKQASTFSQDWIQEFQVMTNSYAAEFGQASGGVLNVITRSGSNGYQGRAYLYYRDEAFDSPPFAGTFENGDVSQPVFLAKDEVPDYAQRRWGGTFGGPLAKDRLFFFAGYEDLLRESNDTLAIGEYWRAQGYATVEPVKTTDHPFLVKVDANLTDRHRLSVRYDRTVNTNVNTTIYFPPAITSHEARGTFGGPVWNLVGNLTSTLGSTSFNELRAYYMSLKPPMTCNASGTGGRANLELGPPGTFALLLYPTLVGGCPPSGLEGEENFGFSDHLTMVRGRHQVKVGGQAVRNRMVIDASFFHDGAWVFDQDVAMDKADPATYPFLFLGATGRANFASPAWVFNLFAQDTWQLSDGLTLTLGLRYDVDQGVTAGNEFVDGKNERIVATLGGTPPLVKTRTDYNNLSPRLAVVWTPTESKRTAVRGAYGHFYDQNHGNFNSVYIVNTLLADANYEVNCYLPGSNPFWGAGEDEGVSACKGFLASDWPYFPDFSKIPTGSQTIWGLDPGLQVVRTMQFSGGVSHEFARGLVVSADVVHARGSGLMFMETNYVLLNPYETQVIDPRFSSIEETTNVGWTHYTALQAHARYRRSRLDVGLAYTLSKADSNITTASIYASTPTNPFDLDQDKGPDATDQRHNVVLNGSYLFPLDFQLAGIVVWRSARPWTVTTVENPEGYVFPPLPEGKNSRRGDSEKTVDLRVSKTFRFGRRASATVFWEMFNTFNWTNFTAYDGLMESPNFGLPTAASDMRRQQLGFRLDF